jgi:hypothetical protein
MAAAANKAKNDVGMIMERKASLNASAHPAPSVRDSSVAFFTGTLCVIVAHSYLIVYSSQQQAMVKGYENTRN